MNAIVRPLDVRNTLSRIDKLEEDSLNREEFSKYQESVNSALEEKDQEIANLQRTLRRCAIFMAILAALIVTLFFMCGSVTGILNQITDVLDQLVTSAASQSAPKLSVVL